MPTRSSSPAAPTPRNRANFAASPHSTPAGTVLGAVTVDIPFAEVRRQGIVAVVMISAAVLVAALIALAVLRRMMNPLSQTARTVQEVTSRAVGGDFSGRVRQYSADEVGEIAVNINRLMDFLEREVNTIRTRVGQLMDHRLQGDGRCSPSPARPHRVALWRPPPLAHAHPLRR